MAASIEEREMTRNQRGLVDTCFEEGQYESGIAVLDQLRSPSFKPPVDHIRQLLYIALFPPPPAAGDRINEQEQLTPPSPVKGSPTKHKPTLTKTSYSPTVVDSEAARRVLFSFLATDSPASLFRALPRYPADDLAGNEFDLPSKPSDNLHDEDSLIARESQCIEDCKNCWAILKAGFIQRKKLLPQEGRKKRARGAYDLEDAELDQGHEAPVVVAEHAWPILQWLLSLFEKDELLHYQKFGEKLSPFLLSQIPPPRGGAGPRWDGGSPLDIIFHSVEQEDVERREMATRLLTLLANLNISRSFDGFVFATTLTTRLYTCDPQIVQNLLEGLPKTIPVLTFKIIVCQKFLSSAPSITGGSKPRPRPLPRRGPRRDFDIASSATDVDMGRAGPSLPQRLVPATCSDVIQMLSTDHTSPKSTLASPLLIVKYALFVSYAHLQGLLPPEERDSDWQTALSNGGLKRIIDTAFPHDSTYHAALTIIASFWPS